MVIQTEELGFEHQIVSMPSVAAPETVTLTLYALHVINPRILSVEFMCLKLNFLQLLSMEQLRERRLIDPRLPR